jgi:hypothetical protein
MFLLFAWIDSFTNQLMKRKFKIDLVLAVNNALCGSAQTSPSSKSERMCVAAEHGPGLHPHPRQSTVATKRRHQSSQAT